MFFALNLLAQEAPKMTLSAREADLRDVLRAATAGTDFNLSFEPGMDTKVSGLDLKNVTLDELLQDWLPNLGLAVKRKGRTLHIHRLEDDFRIYRVDQLAMNRQGSKEFTVNASGQIIQSGQGGGMGGQGGGSAMGSAGGASGGQNQQQGNSSAYFSTLQSGSGQNPWNELEAGLTTLVFGEPAALEPTQTSATSQSQVAAPTPRAHVRQGRRVVIQPDSGLVLVQAPASVQAQVDLYLKELTRRRGRQVLLEARIVEVSLGNDSQIGVDWNSVLYPKAADGGGTSVNVNFKTGDTVTNGLGEGNGLLNLVVENKRILAALSALAREGRLKVLSTPRLSTLNNQKAILRVVREEAYFLQNSQVTPGGGFGQAIATVQITPMVVPVGIVLDIQPQIGDDGMITLAVNPSVSEIVTTRSFNVAGQGGSSGASATLPVVDRRDLDTVVKLRTGETLVLAGILKRREGYDDRGVPWLRRIPWLGNLFTKREKTSSHTELAIFITPTLVEDSASLEQLKRRTESSLEGAETQQPKLIDVPVQP